jgi:hypothetical protein
VENIAGAGESVGQSEGMKCSLKKLILTPYLNFKYSTLMCKESPFTQDNSSRILTGLQLPAATRRICDSQVVNSINCVLLKLKLMRVFQRAENQLKDIRSEKQKNLMVQVGDTRRCALDAGSSAIFASCYVIAEEFCS